MGQRAENSKRCSQLDVKDMDDDLVNSMMRDAETHVERNREKLKKIGNDPLKIARMIDGIHLEKNNREYIAEVGIPQGRVVVKYSEISRARQSFGAVISVQLISTKEGTMPAFEQRLDLNSASGVSQLVTALNGAYGGKKENFNWTLILNRANNALKTAVLEEKKTLTAEGVAYQESPFLLRPFLQKDSANMVFGNSQTGKTYFALYMAACAVLKRDFFDYQTAPFKTLFLDYEDSHQTFVNRLHQIANGLRMEPKDILDSFRYYQPEAALKDESEIIAKFVETEGFDLVIIDAGADASGGSPNDETKVLELFNALNNIPCTKLIIHHEPKNVIGVSAENAYYGTAFWRARVRVGWRLTVESDESNEKIIKATITKNSNMAPVSPFVYKMIWGGQEIGKPSVMFSVMDNFVESDEAKIINFLIEMGESTTEQLIEGTSIKRTTLQRKLDTMLGKEMIERRRDEVHVRRVLWFIPKKSNL